MKDMRLTCCDKFSLYLRLQQIPIQHGTTVGPTANGAYVLGFRAYSINDTAHRSVLYNRFIIHRKHQAHAAKGQGSN